jgi:hypothetical protein
MFFGCETLGSEKWPGSPIGDIVGEFGGVGPAPPRGRDKSGPYALAIASLGFYGQFANNILEQ